MSRYTCLSVLSLAFVFFFFSTVPTFAATQYPGKVLDLQVVDKIDRDGDGKISGFKIKISSQGGKFEFPGPVAKKIEDITSKAFDAISDIPPVAANLLKKLPFKVELAPDICVSVKSQGLGEPIVVEEGLTNTVETKVSASKELLQKIKSEEIDRIDSLEATTNYKVVNIIKAINRIAKMIRNKSLKEVKDIAQDPCGVSDITYITTPDPGKEIKVEPPSKDKLGRVRITSNPDNVQIEVDGNNIGTTPLIDDFPVDIGKVEIKAKKDGYETEVKNVKLNPTKSAKQVIDFKLNRIKKPIVVKSKPSGASININNGVTPYETPYTLDTWIKRSPTITVSDENNSQTFKDVNPPATLEANLKSGSKSNNNSNIFSPTIPGTLGSTAQLPDINYSDIIPPNLNLDVVAAKFSAVPTTTQTGEKVDFDASGSYSMGAAIDGYNWDFRDGSASKGEKVSHVYTDDGNYQVKLTISDKNGKTDSATKTIRVKNRKPFAKFSISKFEAFVGETISFDSSSSSDRDGRIDKYEWSFGDGSTAQGQQVNHTYSSSSNFKVKLTVTDDDGTVNTISRRINIKEKNKPPQANIRVPQKVGVNQEFQLDARNSSDTDGTILRYDWLINNSDYLNGITTTYKFNSTGTKKVSLSVKDTDSQRDEVSTTIKVVEKKVEIEKKQKKKNKKEEKSWWEKLVSWFKSLLGLDS